MEAALLVRARWRLLGGRLVQLAVRRVVVLGGGGDAGERLLARSAGHWLVIRLRGWGRVVVRVVASRGLAGRRLRPPGSCARGASEPDDGSRSG
jgi:hypothetical protein